MLRYHCDLGLKFHGEVVGKYSNLFNELFNQHLIKLCDVRFLSGVETLQLLDPVHGFLPVVAIDFGLLLLVSAPENLIGAL